MKNSSSISRFFILFKLFFFFVFLFQFEFLFATQSITWDGKNKTNYLVVGSSYNSYSGSITGYPQQLATLSLSTSGAFSPTLFYCTINGTNYTNGQSFGLSSGTNSLVVYFETPTSGLTCNAQCTYTITIGQGSGSGTIQIQNESLAGNSDVCINSTNTYNLSWSGTLIGTNGAHTWTLSPTTWVFSNGASSISTADGINSIAVTAPSTAASNGTLSVTTGGHLCTTPVTKTIIIRATVPATPSNSLVANKIGTSCYYTVTVAATAGASGYIWSDNSSFSCTLTDGATVDGVCSYADFLENTSATLYVKAYNACGTSTSYGHKLVGFPAAPLCQPKLENLNQNMSSIPFLYSENGSYFISVGDDYLSSLPAEMQLFNLEGQLISVSPLLSDHQIISTNKLFAGVYFLKVQINHHVFIRKLLID